MEMVVNQNYNKMREELAMIQASWAMEDQRNGWTCNGGEQRAHDEKRAWDEKRKDEKDHWK